MTIIKNMVTLVVVTCVYYPRLASENVVNIFNNTVRNLASSGNNASVRKSVQIRFEI
jgi:hypothetical protein